MKQVEMKQVIDDILDNLISQKALCGCFSVPCAY
jgi:hypothetical protein